MGTNLKTSTEWTKKLISMLMTMRTMSRKKDLPSLRCTKRDKNSQLKKNKLLLRQRYNSREPKNLKWISNFQEKKVKMEVNQRFKKLAQPISQTNKVKRSS